MTHCKDCAWFAPVESMPEAEKIHNHLLNTLGDILPRREDEIGVCRKVTYSKERPVLTHGEGFCHRAERREDGT